MNVRGECLGRWISKQSTWMVARENGRFGRVVEGRDCRRLGNENIFNRSVRHHGETCTNPSLSLGWGNSLLRHSCHPLHIDSFHKRLNDPTNNMFHLSLLETSLTTP